MLFDQLKLPIPLELPAKHTPPFADKPILVYGAGASSGQYITQVLKLAGYTNILATASPKHHQYLRSLGAVHVFDYSSSDLVEQVLNAAGGKLPFVVNCVGTLDTISAIGKFISSEGTVGVLLPMKEGSALIGESQLLTQLPKDTNPFPNTVSIAYANALAYQAVCSQIRAQN